MELLTSFLGACVFTALISVGVGKRLTEHPAGRPVLGALGFFIVIAGFSYSRRDFALFSELVMWFIICCSPVLIMGVIDSLWQREHAEIKHKSELEAKELAHYSVPQPRIIGGTVGEEFDPYGVNDHDHA